jgi:hypothetical protein
MDVCLNIGSGHYHDIRWWLLIYRQLLAERANFSPSH